MKTLSDANKRQSYNPDPNTLADDFRAVHPPLTTKVPTVMQVLPSLHTGGVERGTVDISNALVSTGWNSIVVSAGGNMANQITRAGGRHIKLPIGSKNPLRWRNTYENLLNTAYRYKVDIIHARSRLPAWISFYVAQKQNTPFITTFHGRYGDSNFFKKRYNSIMCRGENVIAISYFIAEEIKQRYGIDESRLRVIQRGVDINTYHPAQVSADRMINLTKSWRVPDGIPIIMLPSRVTRWKGHELLVEALALISDIKFHCLMVGPYTDKLRYKFHLENEIRRYGLSSKIYLVGECNDMPAAYKVADVVISSSIDPEPFGRVIIEAQAMGRPVVASNHGGATESIVEGQTGWLVKPNNPQALAEGIRKALLVSEEQRDRLSENSISSVHKYFSSDEMCLKTMDVYREVLGIKPLRN